MNPSDPSNLAPDPVETTDGPELPDHLLGKLRIAIPGYELLDKIATGGQATVYRARELTSGLTVAIKVLNGGVHAAAGARERRLREAVANRISLGAWAMDRARTEIVGPDGEVVRLTVGEAAILHALAVARGAAVSRGDLLATAGRRHELVSERTVDVLVARIRRKLSGPGRGRPMVLTVSGLGYRLVGG